MYPYFPKSSRGRVDPAVVQTLLKDCDYLKHSRDDQVSKKIIINTIFFSYQNNREEQTILLIPLFVSL
jgi:hypothetical protein